MGNCYTHGRYNCPATKCREEDDRRTDTDNAGQVSLTTSGDLSVGIGSGLGVDPSDGSLTIQVAPGISIDTDGQ